MSQILDYSRGYPGGAAVASRGFAGVARYLRKEGTSNVQPLTAVEIRDMLAHQRSIAFICQHVDKYRPLKGRAAGRHDGAWFAQQARIVLDQAGLTQVTPRAYYFTNDFDSAPAQWPTIREYMLGAAEVVGAAATGTYGEYDLLDYLFVRSSITWGWQTYAWSPGHNHDDEPRHPRAHLFQRREQTAVGGVDCDINDVLKTDHGQYPGGSDVELTDTIPNLTGGPAISVGAVLAKLYRDHAILLPTSDRPHTQDSDDMLGHVLNVEGRLRRLETKVDQLIGRPAADVDEAALAAELEARGIGGVSAAELKDILGSVRLTTGPTS